MWLKNDIKSLLSAPCFLCWLHFHRDCTLVVSQRLSAQQAWFHTNPCTAGKMVYLLLSVLIKFLGLTVIGLLGSYANLQYNCRGQGTEFSGELEHKSHSSPEIYQLIMRGRWIPKYCSAESIDAKWSTTKMLTTLFLGFVWYFWESDTLSLPNGL